MNDTDEVSGRILLAEDEDSLRRGLGRVLSASGYQVVEAADGSTAAALVKAQPFDVVVSDIDMPGANGIELLRVVRSTNLDLPVLLMTGAPDIVTAVAAVSHGALDYLMKPVDGERLLHAVDQAVRIYALARAKRRALELLGGRRPLVHDRAGLEASFDRALGGLFVVYQPIVHARQGKVFGYEALLRSHEPALPHPGAVLDAAEQLGRLNDLGRTVRGIAARPMRDAGGDTALFVNLHPLDLQDELLTSSDSPLHAFARHVVFEITERSALESMDNVRESVEALRALGYRIAIDDLGAGYSGLTSFTQLQPDLVKLDMSLIRGVDADPVRQKLVGTMTRVCNEMGLLVVAEGIETEAERDKLIELGCDLLQGYLFAKPGPPFPGVSSLPPPPR